MVNGTTPGGKSKLNPTRETPVKDNCNAQYHAGEKSGDNVRQWLEESPRTENEVGRNVMPSPSPTSMPWFFGKSLVPKLYLPQFDGDPLKWTDWYGMFQAMIHATPMSDTEKLTHLQHSCVGRAKAEIGGFGYNGSMYANALGSLRDRFGKRQFVVRAHLEKLQRIQPVAEGGNTTVCNLASVVRAVVLTFENWVMRVIFQQ
jgi:hypothetical protein